MNLFRKTFGGKTKQKSPITVPDPEFPKLEGLHYIEFLGRFHELRRPKNYLEVGSQKGLSLRRAQGSCIAIDPSFRISLDVIADKQDLYVYQGTSDDFFASDYLNRVGVRLDLAFLDGMHLFEYLLRDFMNTERYVRDKSSVIALHDCVPYARIMTTREWDRSITRSWTGDVWKLIPILRSLRPDLEVQVLDCEPTGLVLISNCDPQSQVLEGEYQKIIDEYTEMSIDDYGVDRFVNELELCSGDAYLQLR